MQQAFVVPVEDKEFGHRPVAVVEYASQAGDVNLAEWVRDKLARFSTAGSLVDDAVRTEKTEGLKYLAVRSSSGCVRTVKN
ncbi:hypothetical protein [Salmonella enterica]|uniref:hypothetical protein n=1 Tax=Salmonella enterica TaxID=28901 RepID=UPI001E312883